MKSKDEFRYPYHCECYLDKPHVTDEVPRVLPPGDAAPKTPTQDHKAKASAATRAAPPAASPALLAAAVAVAVAAANAVAAARPGFPSG
ncbi:Protein of unknown function [Gryllus bimaculatus]|nr:Protein of unknown function [Gryllus bimaculatus]